MVRPVPPRSWADTFRSLLAQFGAIDELHLQWMGDAVLPYPEQGAEPVRLLALAEFLGAAAVGTHLEFPLTERDHQELSESGVASSLRPGSYICIHPGARIRDKCWPPQRFAEVADRLAFEFDLPVVLTGSAKEADLTAEVARHMRTPVVDAAAPIDRNDGRADEPCPPAGLQ